jgi:nucleotide-binding universal stress UspA family protein
MSKELGVVVAVDGSPSSDAATQWAAHDAELRGVPLTIVHATPPVVGTWPTMAALPDVSSWQQDAGQRILEEAVAVATEAINIELRISTEMLPTATVPALVELTREAELVVVGNRGRGRLARALLGSVSMGLVHHSRCPVAVIRDEPSTATALTSGPILLGFDGSPASETATALAFEEALRRRAELVVLHAWWGSGAFEFPVEWDDLRIEVEESLARQMAVWQGRYPDVPMRTIVVRDQPALRLVDYPATPQMIVVGSHGHGGITSTLLGSVSTAVVQAARVPVVVARS